MVCATHFSPILIIIEVGNLDKIKRDKVHNELLTIQAGSLWSRHKMP